MVEEYGFSTLILYCCCGIDHISINKIDELEICLVKATNIHNGLSLLILAAVSYTLKFLQSTLLMLQVSLGCSLLIQEKKEGVAFQMVIGGCHRIFSRCGGYYKNRLRSSRVIA